MVSSEFGPSGRALYDAITEALDLEAHELALLREACRVTDRLDGLHLVLDKQGLTLPDGRAHPALTEARQQGITLARLLAALRLPDDIGEATQRPQHRSVRGVYHGLRAVSQ